MNAGAGTARPGPKGVLLPVTRLLLKPAQCTAASAGPKAATLARALDAGLPVPPFLVVAADAYRAHLARATRSFAPDAPPDPAALRSAISNTSLAFDLGAELVSALTRLGPKVAVRSSATAEDLPGLSFAGQYESILDVDVDGLEDAVLACWASLWGDRAVAYRARNAVPHDAVAMAVIVQRFVPCALGGVAFTADPVSGERHVVVESSAEGAEAIVSGRVAPERHVFELAELDAAGEGLVPAADVRAADALATDIPAAEVPRSAALLARSAEGLIGVPADIEWGWSDGRLWLLQARPITAAAAPATPVPTPEATPPVALASAPEATPPVALASAPEAAAAGHPATGPRYRLTAWSNVNTGEVLPDVVTPMTWSIVGKLATGLIDSLFGKLGIRIDRSRLTTLIAGRAYFNASILVSAFEQIPMSGDITTIFGGGDAPPGYMDLPAAPEDTAHVSAIRAVLGLPVVLVWFVRHSPGSARRLCNRVVIETRVARGDISRTTDEAELARLADRIVHTLDSMIDAIAFSGVAMARYTQFVASATRHFGDEGPALANMLLAGQGGVASADAGLALARLGALARAHAQVAAALRSSPGWTDVRLRLGQLDADGDGFLSAWDDFMVDHGHHARGELEFGAPRWSETPDDVLAMVTGLLDVEPADDLVVAYEARAQRAAAEETRVLASLGPLARMRFRRLLRHAREGARTRENLKNEGVRSLAVGRTALLALGGAMAERDLLDAADDILFLTWDEVAPVRAGTLDARPLVSARRAGYEANRALTPPSIVLGEWDGAPAGSALEAFGTGGDAPARPDAVAGPATLTGLGVAAGVARGPARVIHSLHSTERVLPGEVLVAPFTDPGWTPYFVPAAAIVVDMGGMLSHGSIIAREYGIPGVVNVGPATSLIRTGDIVEVDGSRGVVTIVERAAES